MPSSAAAPSSEYRLFETETFRKSLMRIASSDFLRRKLQAHVYPQLRRGPFYGPNIRKLRDYEPPRWRYRIGAFRVFYLIDEEEKMVIILSVDDRKDAYR